MIRSPVVLRYRTSLFLSFLLLTSPLTAVAQRGGEYLTDKEMDAVRTAQRIDVRAEVFTKIADRRLLALTNPTAKLTDKEIRIYGELPKGSQVDLLDDYRRTMDEFMEKIDDSYSREGKTKLFVKGMETTRLAIDRQLKELAALRAQLKDPDAVQFCIKAVEAAKLLAEGVADVLATPDPPAP